MDNKSLVDYINKKIEYELVRREVQEDGQTGSCIAERKKMEEAQAKLVQKVNEGSILVDVIVAKTLQEVGDIIENTGISGTYGWEERWEDDIEGTLKAIGTECKGRAEEIKGK